ncbi:MAG TPA: hypothetical protein DCP92_00925 [Nitrospiraceae bacterium]|jgi:CheY-like chemotaxis protein|nr:hypothetical protein [Nitrospiraceae bacterium]
MDKAIKKKILIVEDEVIEAMFLKNILELWGYEVCEITTSGDDAITEAETEKPDLVLMDVHIPGTLNGIESAHMIRSQAGIPIIFMTGYSDEETRQKARSAQPAEYFIKPLNYDKLKDALKSIIH